MAYNPGGGSGAVDSVFARTGVVAAASNDYTWAQIDKATSSLANITTRNYSDLAGLPTLGSAAATAVGDYATAAQGATANSALQPAGNGGSLSGLTKTQVGLANVDNTTDAGKPISTATQTALDLKQSLSAKGAINGYAGLDGAGLVPVAQLPGIPAAWGEITGVLATQADLQSALDAKQATLVSATNIKTINGSTVLGSGDLVVSGALPALVIALLSTGAADQTVAAGYGAYIPSSYEIASGQFLEVGADSVMEIG